MISSALKTAFTSAIGIVILLALPRIALATSPSDYDVPESTAQQLRLGATYGYAGSGGDTQTNDGSASLIYNRFFNSLPYAYDLNFNGVGTTRRTPADKQNNSYNFLANAGVRKYLNPDGNLFYSGDAQINGDDDFDRPGITATPGLGYGRFIRVTTLAQAVRIEEFLLEEKVIKGRLPKKTMIKLAQIIERRAEFETEHGNRYKVFWIAAMEEAIAASGKFTEEGLGAVGTLRVDEVLFQEHINERFIGWDARGGIGLELLNPIEKVDRQDPGFSLRLRYSRPVGWKSQVDVTAQYGSPFTGDFGANVYDLSGTVNYLYEVTNRIDFTLSNILTVSRFDPDVDSQVSEQLRTGFIFFIENQINLNLTGQFSKDRGEDATQGINLALEYRLR